jgi:enamine deaminase RidA (YjgF/YER057c/UK114 family)
MDIDAKLAELGIELPPTPKPLASYVPCVVAGGVAYCAGQIPMEDGKPMWTGHVGDDVSPEDAAAGARRCALQALAALRDALGGFGRLKRILRLEVLVAAAPGFTGEPQVANGASDLLGELMGEAGVHARVAIGVAELPLGVPVEVVVTAEVVPA